MRGATKVYGHCEPIKTRWIGINNDRKTGLVVEQSESINALGQWLWNLKYLCGRVRPNTGCQNFDGKVDAIVASLLKI